MSAYTLPLTCLDCGNELDLSPGELHDTDHTSASARCGCGARFTADGRAKVRLPSSAVISVPVESLTIIDGDGTP